MKLSRIAARAALLAALAAAALGVRADLASADPHDPPWPPVDPGPGVNAGWPGNPLPPGQGYVPPPGHRGGFTGVAPMWAPPAPAPPWWAPWLPVVWNDDLPSWGVWWNGAFVTLG